MTYKQLKTNNSPLAKFLLEIYIQGKMSLGDIITLFNKYK